VRAQPRSANRKKVTEVALYEGDELVAGSTRLTFHSGPAEDHVRLFDFRVRLAQLDGAQVEPGRLDDYALRDGASARRANALAALWARVAREESVSSVRTMLVAEALRELDVDVASFWLVGPAGLWTETDRARRDRADGAAVVPPRLLAWVLKNRGMALVSNDFAGDGAVGQPDPNNDQNVRAVLAAPVINSRQLRGALICDLRQQAGSFRAEEAAFAIGLVDVCLGKLGFGAALPRIG